MQIRWPSLWGQIDSNLSHKAVQYSSVTITLQLPRRSIGEVHCRAFVRQTTQPCVNRSLVYICSPKEKSKEKHFKVQRLAPQSAGSHVPFGLNLNTVMAPGGKRRERKKKRNYNQEQAKGQIVFALRLVQRCCDYNSRARVSASDSDWFRNSAQWICGKRTSNMLCVHAGIKAREGVVQ